MKTRLKEFIETNALFSSNDKVLIGASGGRDSMCLCHLLHELGFDIGIAHVNYQLRGQDSALDQALVEKFASERGIPFHLKVVEMVDAKSLQLEARKIRYEYFQELADKSTYDVICTAHHADDSVETLFLNIMRGTGIHGLKGIPVKTETIARPLLWATREEIDDYTSSQGIAFRDDRSNEGDAYLRNRVRHYLIPIINEIDPSSMKKILTSIHHLEQDAQAVESLAHGIWEDGKLSLDSLPAIDRPVWLYHAVRRFGFNRKQCSELITPPNSGKRIANGQYELILTKGSVEVIQKNDSNL